ncbi:MAG: multidrug ABC transporter ATP-binding protein [Candidatus Proteinoplasmatales archaeon SG8-5]|nr:MAG: multidrug ABC transporter ATP-binding protein [Candidatus Proteinoplasmatales archaeon SG8-5]
MITTKGLSRAFGPILAVNKLDLNIQDGQIFGLIGPNGAGKTTTIRMLTCLIEPTLGSAQLDGFDIRKEDDKYRIREITGLLPESPGLYETLSAYQNLEYYADLYDMDPTVKDLSIERYLRMLGIWDKSDVTCGTFSRGMKQKLAIVRALIHEPKYLLLDEPTASLDPASVATVREFISELKTKKRTIFINTHNLDEAERLCDRVGIFNKKLIAEGTPKELALKLWPRRVVIEVRNPNEWYAKNLSALSGVTFVEATGLRLMVDVDDPGVRAPEIVKVLVENGAEVSSVNEEVHNLEEVYLELIGGKS